MSTFHHPYEIYEGTLLWKILENAISDLVKNTDIQETTRREYIVGYLIKCLKSSIKGSLDEYLQHNDELDK